MEGGVVDIFATKGIEYLLVIGFLGALILFWVLLFRSPAGARQRVRVMERLDPSGWFSLPEGFLVHQGHAWTRPETRGTVLAGMDDFAQKLVGEADAIDLPPVGSRLEQGGRGWAMQVGGRTIPVLSPVSGEVVAVNEDAVERPTLVNREPYGEGWLVKVRTPRWRADRAGLMSGALARAWMAENIGALRRVMAPQLGLALQDGGTPVQGIARTLAPDDWDQLASHFLMTADDGDQARVEGGQDDASRDGG
jgi:glycine cleavage system H protein